MVLLGEHLRGRHNRGLRAGLGGAEHGEESHQSLAAAHVALQQAQHPAWCSQVLINFRDGLHLRRGERVAEPGQGRLAQRAVAEERPAGPVPLACADVGERDLMGEQLVVGEALPRGLAGRCLGRLHLMQRLGETGPAFAPHQMRVVPLGQARHPLQRPP